MRVTKNQMFGIGQSKNYVLQLESHLHRNSSNWFLVKNRDRSLQNWQNLYYTCLQA